MVLSFLLKPFQSAPEARAPRGERGIAMITAIIVIAMMLIFTSDMIINSTVSLRLAVATRDNIKAEYMAKSGLNLAIFLLQAEWGKDLYTFQAAGALPSDGPEDFWSKINGMPIGGGTADMLSATSDSFNLSKVNDSTVIDQLKSFDGQFVVQIEDEGSRININKCFNRSYECEHMIKALVSCPAEKAYLEERKAHPEDFYNNIKDWTDPDDSASGGGGGTSEQDAYQDRVPKTRPKNAPFDSLEELKQVAGWDTDIFEIFSPYFTVFPYADLVSGRDGEAERPYVNINSASKALVGCLLPQVNATIGAKTAVLYDKLPDQESLPQIDSASARNQRLSELFGETDKERVNYFSYTSDTYRVTVKGEVGEQVRTIEAVMQRKFPTEAEKKQNIRAAYKILQFKML